MVVLNGFNPYCKIQLISMSKYIYTILLLFFLFKFDAQNPIPTNPETLDLETDFITAMQDVALEEYDDALSKLKKLKKIVKNDGIIDFEIAKIYLVKNEVEDAEISIKKAIKKDGTKEIYKLFLLDLLKEQQKYIEAAELMESMLEHKNYNRIDYFKTADLYQRAKDTKKALNILSLLEKKIGYNREIELHRISILLRAKNFKKGLAVIDDLLKKDQNDIYVLTKKAMVYRLMNNPEKASETYKSILKIDPQNPVASSYIHIRKKFQQKEEDYVKDLLPVLNNPKVSIDEKIKMLLPFVERVSKGSELTKELSNASSIVLKQYPLDAKANALYADILYNSGEIKESIPYYKASLKDSKKNFEIWKQLMTIYSFLKEWKNLAKLSEDAIDYYPNQVYGYYNAGKAYLNLGKTKKGLDYLDEALLYSSNNPTFNNEIILLQVHGYILKNKSSKASTLLENLNDEFKLSHPYYWELKGDIEKENNDIKKAKEYWEKSLKLGNTTDRLLNKLRN